MIYKNGVRMRDFGPFCFHCSLVLFFGGGGGGGGVFNKTTIPLALVGYEMIILYHLISYYIISYPTRAHGIIVNYNITKAKRVF